MGIGNGLSPVQYEAIIWNNANLMSFGPIGTKVIEIWTQIADISFKKMPLKMLFVKQG